MLISNHNMDKIKETKALNQLTISFNRLKFQCRIKLKNLKSQYRYVKDRIPNIDELDLEDDDVVKDLITKCQVKIKPLKVN